MVSNKLISELRADINGKLVTRHVKAVPNKPVSGSALPAPVTSSPSPHNYFSNINTLKNAIASALETGAYDGIDEVQPNTIYPALNNLQPHVVEAYRQQIDATPDIGYEDLLISVLTNNLNSDKAGYILFVTSHAVPKEGLSNEWDSDIQGTYEHENSAKVLKGVEEFCKANSYNFPSDIFKADVKTTETITALTTLIKLGYEKDIAGIFDNWSTGSIYIDDTDLGRLAVDYVNDVERIVTLLKESRLEAYQVRAVLEMEREYPDSANRVMEIMRERSTSDRKVIRSILDAEVQPLSNGVL